MSRQRREQVARKRAGLSGPPPGAGLEIPGQLKVNSQFTHGANAYPTTSAIQIGSALQMFTVGGMTKIEKWAGQILCQLLEQLGPPPLDVEEGQEYELTREAKLASYAVDCAEVLHEEIVVRMMAAQEAAMAERAAAEKQQASENDPRSKGSKIELG